MSKLWAKDENGIKCLACCHYCRLAEGKSGLCGVRVNNHGELKLLVYGRPCAVNIDPIEKKPLYHFLPGTEVLSLGTFGCNFSCGFCQNWDISQLTKKDGVVDGEEINWQGFLKNLENVPPEKIAERAAKNNLPSIAYTYNEPTIWTEYAMDIAKLAREQGVKNIYVSNGYMSPETCIGLEKYLDAINIDLKSFSDKFYLKTCGGHLQSVLDNIRRLHKAGVWVEITTLVIPGENDSDEELKQIAEFIVSVSPDMPWHLSAFHADYKMNTHEPTAPESLVRGREIGKKAGLKYVYIGNVEAGEYGNTFCPVCRELLIERGFMSAGIKNLKEGRCGKCGEKIAGVF